jgi:hypothetical protein
MILSRKSSLAWGELEIKLKILAHIAPSRCGFFMVTSTVSSIPA